MAGYGVGNIIFTRQDWNDKDIFTILTAHGDKFLSHLLFMYVHLPPAHLILSMLFFKNNNNVYTVCMHGHILSSLPPKFNNISIIKKMMCIPAFLSLQHRAHCFAFLVSPQCQPAYLHMSSCQAAECTCCDTCIWSRSQCPRRCAGSLHCHGYKSL